MRAEERSNAPLLVAFEWFHLRLEDAVALHRRAEATLIALRICETIETQDFHECQLLASPLVVTSDPPAE